MKLLVDESLSRRVATMLAEAGYDVVHVADRNLLAAPDKEIMQAARSENRVVIAADTDFGELLALGQHPGPSVVIFRRAPHRPEQQASILLAALPDLADRLDEGAVVSMTSEAARVRRLPIEPK